MISLQKKTKEGKTNQKNRKQQWQLYQEIGPTEVFFDTWMEGDEGTRKIRTKNQKLGTPG